MPESFLINDNLIDPPAADGSEVEVRRGPNIKPFPQNAPLSDSVTKRALLVVGDNITTDDIMPSYASLLPYRSNIPHLAEYCFSGRDPGFPARAAAAGAGVIVAGANYGQGSSREHAALAPLHLGIKAVVARSFARIHRANLINFGLLPLLFSDPADYDRLSLGEKLVFPRLTAQIAGGPEITAETGAGRAMTFLLDATPRERKIILAGGLLNLTRQGGGDA